jgi:uncharacterized protein (UPF0332 family)
MDPTNIQAEFSRVLEALHGARLFQADGLYEDAVAWSYKAVSHAARATLLAHECRVKTHVELRRAFSSLLVRTDRIEKGQARILTHIQDRWINLGINAHGPLFLAME